MNLTKIVRINNPAQEERMDEKLLPLKEFIVKIIHADKGPMRTIDLYDSSAIANAIVAELNRRAEQPQGEK